MQKHPGQSYLEANVQPSQTGENQSKTLRPFKLYQSCEQIKCTYEGLEQTETLTENELERVQMGQMLTDIYGLTRQNHMFKEEWQPSQSFSQQWSNNTSTFYLSLLRPVPSGGALFPCELYLLVDPGRAFPAGLYHYDPAHHALDIIQQGDHSQQLQIFLAHPDEALPGYALLLSCFFWKDGSKYGAFSYRLQGLDIGAVIGQSLIVSEHYHLQATVHYQFLDKAIDEFVGLDPLHESIYAAITFASTLDLLPDTMVTHTEEPIQRQPTAEPLESVARWPLAEALHRASLIETRAAFCPPGSLTPIKRTKSIGNLILPPDELLDLWQARHLRRSAASFRPAPLSEQQLAQLVLACTRGTNNDLDGRSNFLLHTLLYCVVNAVQNIPAGIYCYHPKEHRLALIATKKVVGKLQDLPGWPNINLLSASVCFLPVANYQEGFQVYGDRWYRIQNMEAGIIAQRLYLAAAALKLACRANLGFPVPAMDQFLCLPEKHTSLLQVFVGLEHSTHGHYTQSLLL